MLLNTTLLFIIVLSEGISPEIPLYQVGEIHSTSLETSIILLVTYVALPTELLSHVIEYWKLVHMAK